MSGRSMLTRTWFALLGLLVSLSPTPTVRAAAQGFVPAGTVLNVRTTQPLSPEYAQPGMRVVGIVDDPVYVNGRIVVPRGAAATLEVAGVAEASNMKGPDRLGRRLHQVHSNSRH